MMRGKLDGGRDVWGRTGVKQSAAKEVYAVWC